MAMETGVLVKLGSLTENVSAAPLRTKEVRCAFRSRPVIGRAFVVIAEALESGICRMVATSPVATITDSGDRILFSTENSVYELELRADEELLEKLGEIPYLSRDLP